MAEIPHVRLRLSNRAENVLLVRQALNGVGEAVELDPVELNDVSTAVSEACNNVVLHAYVDEEGPMEVEVYAASPRLEVVVRDHGVGIKPRERPPDEIVGGIGLPVIRALTHTVVFGEPPGGGTEVRMRFATAQRRALEPPRAAGDGAAGHASGAAGDASGEAGHADSAIRHASGAATVPAQRTSLTVGPTALARTVLPRILSALAARAYFSTDRICDTQLLADALVAHSEGSIDGSRLDVEIDVAPRDLLLRIGPLHEGRAAGVLHDASVDGLGSVLERLADGHEVSRSGASEILGLRLAERRG